MAARTARFAEMVEALDGLLTHGAYSYAGAHYVIADARTLPGSAPAAAPPARGRGRRAEGARAHGARTATRGSPSATRGTTAAPAGTERAVRDQVRRLEDACAAIGRDPATIERILLAGAGDDRPTRVASTRSPTIAGRYRDARHHRHRRAPPARRGPALGRPARRARPIAADVLPGLRAAPD